MKVSVGVVGIWSDPHTLHPRFCSCLCFLVLLLSTFILIPVCPWSVPWFVPTRLWAPSASVNHVYTAFVYSIIIPSVFLSP